jgi:outer membrane receptor protein involved in Fe transport
MKTLKLITLALLLMTAGNLWSQCKITGRVTDKQSKQGIEYATVSILKASDSSLVNGAVSDTRGNFAVSKLAFGKYLIRITFIGYGDYYTAQPVTMSVKHTNYDMGQVELSATSAMMNAVEVSAERSMVEYKLDKRVVNVDKNIVSSGGTATDVLETVPSVAIDNDGNVSLRGSSNVKVLIDGRSYELLNSDLNVLLEQIPASTVESVEVITNPSAKYDPEGMSGIINIKLKDKASAAFGWNGVVNLNAGAPLPILTPDNMQKFIPTTMGSVNLNYTTERYSINFSADAGLRQRGNFGNTLIERRHSGVAYQRDSLNERSVGGGKMIGFKLGGEYYFKNNSSLLASYQLHGGVHENKSVVDALDLFNDPALHNYRQADTGDRSNINHTFNVSYIKKFDKKEQEFTADFTYSLRTGPGTGTQEQIYEDYGYNLLNYYKRETDNKRHENSMNARVNYTHPFSEKWKLETGYEGNMLFSNQDNRYFMTTYGTDSSLHKALDVLSSTHYIYQQQVHGVYVTLGGQLSEKLSIQAGLRGEYSLVKGHDDNHPETQEVNKPYHQLYPTLHASYNISKTQSLQVSYSRRVQRPHMWDLNPYMRVEEGQQLSFGNPSLDPEFTNAFELSHNLALKTTNLFTSLYFRQTNNMMTRYGYVWDAATAAYYSPWMNYNSEYDGYWASTWQNLDKGLNYGLEFIVDQQITKWWKINVSINLYESYIQGTALLNDSSRTAFRAGGKFNSYMTLPKDWTVQFSGQYNAPFMDLQTDMNAYYWCDLAVKKDLWNHSANINFRVNDIFMTGGFGHRTDNEQLYRVYEGRRISPTITIGFSYKINNGLKKSETHRNEESEESDTESY